MKFIDIEGKDHMIDINNKIITRINKELHNFFKFHSSFLDILFKLILIILSICATSAKADSKLEIKPGSELIFETTNGQTVRIVSSFNEYSYKFKNRTEQEIETIYGTIDINSGQNQFLSKSERQNIEKFNISKIGDSLRFYINGNSGSGNWTRTVNIQVKSEETLNYKEKLYPTKILEGRVSASNTYDLTFKCWYNIELKLCLKLETDTYSQRNPSANGKNLITLIEIK